MCGIAGFIGSGSQNDLMAMTNALSHRGPDDNGHFIHADQPVFLGHRRLSIIDISGGHQPMLSSDKRYSLIFNGEIYNHQALRTELEDLGAVFSTTSSDTEVILIGYQYWGKDLFSKLNGMFAIVIYDQSSKKLILARDRFGEKPLYYMMQNNIFAFASELKAFNQHKDLNVDLDPMALKKFFIFNMIPAPSTIYKDCYKLCPGQLIEYDLQQRNLKHQYYYQFQINEDHSLLKRDENDLIDELDELLTESVRLRLQSEVPLGCFLSGGLDSSLITAIAAKQKIGSNLKTFSVSVDHPSFDEYKYAYQVSKFLGVNNEKIHLSMEQAYQQIPEILAELDEPFGDYSFIPTYLVCQGAKKHATVALGGDGADELFAGYETFKGLLPAQILGKLPQFARASACSLSQILPAQSGYMNLTYKLQRMLAGLKYRPSQWNPMWLSSLEPADLEQLFDEPTNITDLFSDIETLWQSNIAGDLQTRTLEYYTRFYMGDGIFTKVDRASMCHSLEVRAPFLDNHLTDFAAKLPWSLKFRHGKGKYLLRKLAERYLPMDIINRKKHGFSVPIKDWTRDVAWDYHQSSQMPLKFEALDNLLSLDKRGIRDLRQFKWNLYTLQNTRYLDIDA